MCRPFPRIPFSKQLRSLLSFASFSAEKEGIREKKVDNQNLMFCPLVRPAPSKIMDNTRKTVNIIVLCSYTRFDEFAIKPQKARNCLVTYKHISGIKCQDDVPGRSESAARVEISLNQPCPSDSSISLPTGT